MLALDIVFTLCKGSFVWLAILLCPPEHEPHIGFPTDFFFKPAHFIRNILTAFADQNRFRLDELLVHSFIERIVVKKIYKAACQKILQEVRQFILQLCFRSPDSSCGMQQGNSSMARQGTLQKRIVWYIYRHWWNSRGIQGLYALLR